MAVSLLRRLPVTAQGDSLAGCSLRHAIRFLGEPLARAYEAAVMGEMPERLPDPRFSDLVRFAQAANEAPESITPAVVRFLEPHFDEAEATSLIAFAGAARMYPHVLRSV